MQGLCAGAKCCAGPWRPVSLWPLLIKVIQKVPRPCRRVVHMCSGARTACCVGGDCPAMRRLVCVGPGPCTSQGAGFVCTRGLGGAMHGLESTCCCVPAGVCVILSQVCSGAGEMQGQLPCVAHVWMLVSHTGLSASIRPQSVTGGSGANIWHSTAPRLHLPSTHAATSNGCRAH